MAGYFTDKEKKLYQFAGGDNSTKYCLPVGTIFPSAIPLTDASVHLLDGGTISQTGVYQEFAELLKSLVSAGYNISCSQSDFDSAVSSTGNCGKFVIDNTLNTIRLPKITRFIQGLSNMIDIGNSVEAGLPNIEGYFTGRPHSTSMGSLASEVSGAFTYTKQGGLPDWSPIATASGGYNPDKVSFDASLSSSVYGDSDTVQPQATSFPYYIVLASGFTNYANLDIKKLIDSKLSLTGGTLDGNLIINGKSVTPLKLKSGNNSEMCNIEFDNQDGSVIGSLVMSGKRLYIIEDSTMKELALKDEVPNALNSTILWSGSSNGTITLNDNVNNYKYLEIYYAGDTGTTTGESSKRVQAKNYYGLHLEVVEMDSTYSSNYGYVLKQNKYNLVDNTLTVVASCRMYKYQSDSVVQMDQKNQVVIRKIIGYK